MINDSGVVSATWTLPAGMNSSMIEISTSPPSGGRVLPGREPCVLGRHRPRLGHELRKPDVRLIRGGLLPPHRRLRRLSAESARLPGVLGRGPLHGPAAASTGPGPARAEPPAPARVVEPPAVPGERLPRSRDEPRDQHRRAGPRPVPQREHDPLRASRHGSDRFTSPAGLPGGTLYVHVPAATRSRATRRVRRAVRSASRRPRRSPCRPARRASRRPATAATASRLRGRFRRTPSSTSSRSRPAPRSTRTGRSRERTRSCSTSSRGRELQVRPFAKARHLLRARGEPAVGRVLLPGLLDVHRRVLGHGAGHDPRGPNAGTGVVDCRLRATRPPLWHRSR